ncbi:superoxide dismutase [Cu-Zn]-like [Arctopsyche grandis]|uniref:superoxide dismutase [Cu-Zn]-like n=1 Tax=Arctopsyche grandis TaxID=121162 RepID=UPI00406D9B8C
MRKLFCILLIVTNFIIINSKILNQLNFSPVKMRKICVVTFMEKNVTCHVTFTQEREGSPLVIRGYVIGLVPGKYLLDIHENGDVSSKCDKIGPHFNVPNIVFTDRRHHLGQFGNITAGSKGKVRTDFIDKYLSLSGPRSIVGRSLTIHASKTKSNILHCATIKLVD